MVKINMKPCRPAFDAGEAAAIIAFLKLVWDILSAFLGF